ncbi:MAG TPA: hypothetical protein VJ772_04960 [Nitrososphaeraceae archaeon]|nr:hypothetical protein [Nitrososphaeraceae archaeon]
MKFGLERKGFEEALKSLDDLAKGVHPDELAKWVRTIEATAKNLCNDSEDKIVFRHLQESELKFSVKDKKSRDCLVKAIETHIDAMPTMLQGFFRVLKYKLANTDTNQ